MFDYGQSDSNVITSDRVNGTAVYGLDDRHVGTIDHLVIDKQSGKIGYAVMSFGGFLGLGEEYYPIPWNKLRYDTRLGGYRTDITEEQLRGAPARRDDWYRDRAYEERLHGHYGAPAYWV
ncbi:PRC-barrel domain-containing protein [Rubellimicrobium sp. CFH 75288]|uniref:PRC-barrel domain-containing protein n=1 Tax=Rubellimicrobium sp. CFH 75288 TaxID=2697034 RepID=UPI0014125F76|nr:PRC-barrel domain-containing protein [Rubellimicrobium sp. CFH 75288]NAZ36855.1 PRC-barrel domain containing protein [Rubellimicrobium sp. CFH 75288]